MNLPLLAASHLAVAGAVVAFESVAPALASVTSPAADVFPQSPVS